MWTSFVHRRLAEREKVAAAIIGMPGRLSVRGKKLHDGHHGLAFAGTGFADDGDRFARVHVKVDTADRLDRSIEGRKGHAQIADGKDRFSHAQRSFGSSASRRPSPTKFSAKSVDTRNTAGKISSQLALPMFFAPAAISTPQLVIGS